MAPAPAAARHVGCSCAELERTGLGAQPVAKLFSCMKNLSAEGRKNRTGIGAHPPAPPGARKTSSSQAKQRAMSGVLNLEEGAWYAVGGGGLILSDLTPTTPTPESRAGAPALNSKTSLSSRQNI